MKNKEIYRFLQGVPIDFVIYGNFNFVDGPNEDIDILIKANDYIKLRSYLISSNFTFHELKHYPNQIFITSTEIKLHITDDLYVGGRNVAYWIKLDLINSIFKKPTKWNNLMIIDKEDFISYRVIKKVFNFKKKIKLNEYPIRISLPKNFVFLKKIIGLVIISVASNFIYIIPRIFKKRLWAR